MAAALHEIVRDMLAAGASDAEIVATVRGFEAALGALARDPGAERRRAADRERKAAKKAAVPRNSAESAEPPPDPRAHVVGLPSLRSGDKNSSLRSESTAVAVLDARDRLWSEGREILATIAQKPDPAARSLIGKFLKSAGNDAERVLGAIIAARDHRVIDPVPWITQHLAKPNPSAPNDFRSPSERRFAQAFDDIGERLRDIGCP